MKTPMLEYCKTIIEKVSFDRGLMEKELRKSLDFLAHDEIKELKIWFDTRFASQEDRLTEHYFEHALRL